MKWLISDTKKSFESIDWNYRQNIKFWTHKTVRYLNSMWKYFVCLLCKVTIECITPWHLNFSNKTIDSDIVLLKSLCIKTKEIDLLNNKLFPLKIQFEDKSWSDIRRFF